MTVIKELPHIHKWTKNLYNPNGRYWFHVCTGFVTVKKGKIEKNVPWDMVERWTTIIARSWEIPNVKNEREERIIQLRSE